MQKYCALVLFYDSFSPISDLRLRKLHSVIRPARCFMYVLMVIILHYAKQVCPVQPSWGTNGTSAEDYTQVAFPCFFQQWNDAPERSHSKISFIKKSFLSHIGGNHAGS